ncbi:uncharacterized protein LOC115746325 isoform X1 [Rhodamnia argentea]|uniref:Uncharacterized protein LOC115746325 isoform X1 n=2 Tax=Rhodamnia argentea TaxID=178133 RepID=A0A8B8PT10_9MYRT|nr:uncharacterized protein LOC115746325 isoform X1 [Rhodamnia argentea]
MLSCLKNQPGVFPQPPPTPLPLSLPNMGVFYHEEEPPNPSKRCKCLSAALKEAFSQCHTFDRQLSRSTPKEEHPMSDSDDEQEEVVSEIRSRAMEKRRRKVNFTTESFSFVFSPAMDELSFTHRQDADHDEHDKEEFLTVRSCFTCCSSAATASRDEFMTVRTDFSRCSSLNEMMLQEMRRRSIIQEFCNCEGWPFGLCRKLLLLPPLPKSPAESWSWRRGTRLRRMPYI